MTDKQTEAMKLALEALEVATTPFARDRQEVLRAQAALREALAEQPAHQEPEQSDIFCGVDFADGMLSVSVLRRRADDVAELLHAEQIELPAQRTWVDPNNKTQKQYLPHIGEPVLFCHGGKTYTGKHTGGSFQSEVTNQYFNTWECRWMYLPAAHGIKENT